MCPICLDVAVLPVSLLCQHKGCRECLKKLQKSDPAQALKCPVCRKEHPGELVLDRDLRETLADIFAAAGDESYAQRSAAAEAACEAEEAQEKLQTVAAVSERFRLIPLRNCLFTPELQRQSRGMAYLTGVQTGNAWARG